MAPKTKKGIPKKVKSVKENVWEVDVLPGITASDKAVKLFQI